MRVSKKMQKKRKMNKRKIGIALCIILITGALVVIFLPNNIFNKPKTSSQTAKSNTYTNTQVATNNNTMTNTNVITNTNTNTNMTTNTNVVSNTVQTNTQTASTTTTNNNNSQTTSSNNNSSSSSSGNWFTNLFNKETDENKAREIAVEEFKKLGEDVKKEDLTVLDLERKDGLMYFYIKSKKNTCEIRKKDGVLTRLNAKPVNE